MSTILPLAAFASGGSGSGGGGSNGGGGGAGGTTFVGLSLSVKDEMAPPNGMVQMKVVVTEPTPITTGSTKVPFDMDIFGDINGIALFSPNGDACGAAVVSAGQMALRVISPSSQFGTGLDYPVLATAVRVKPNLYPGQRATMTLDASTWMSNSLGQTYPMEVKAGTFTVAGSVSITDVKPGGAVLPPNSTISIIGMGFTSRSVVRLKNYHVIETRFISASQLDVVVREGVQMHGLSVQVTNPDGSSSLYYAYLRATALGVAARPLLAATVPVFASLTYSAADFQLPAYAGSVFPALALQNPNLSAVDATVSLRDSQGVELARSTVTMPSGTKITREGSEWLNEVAVPAGSFWNVTSTRPIQILGLSGDDGAGTMAPIAPFRSQP